MMNDQDLQQKTFVTDILEKLSDQFSQPLKELGKNCGIISDLVKAQNQKQNDTTKKTELVDNELYQEIKQ